MRPPSASRDYDYVIVGAGSAGCVLANRLSADPSIRVALVEAGGSDRRFPVNAQIRVPAAVVTLMGNARHDWKFSWSGGAELGGREVRCARGRVVGGSSSINGMVYTRGHRADFDHWAALGNRGWSYDEVLPFFKKSENFEGGASAFHGVGGELNVAEQRSRNPLSQALLDAAAEVQLPANADMNGAEQEGFGAFHVTQKNGERWSSARGFLHPVLGRPNLEVLHGRLTEQVVFEGRRAVGVEVSGPAGRERLTVRREVILSAGAVGSPHLLLLWGVGEGAELARHGIEVVHDLPGVGRNLQDHQDVPITQAGRTAHSFGLSWAAAPWMIAAPFQYLFARRGPLTTTTVETGGFVRSSPDEDRPDIELIFAPLLKNQPGRLIPRGHGYTLHVSLVRPESRGRLSLASADPAAKPVLDSNFLSREEDVARLLRGVKLARRVLAAPAFAPYRGEEVAPGASVQSDEGLIQFVRDNVATTFHPAGSCKMGNDPEAVVDDELRVHGLEGLRVVDASIMPTVVAAPTNAATIMIGEKGAALILAARA